MKNLIWDECYGLMVTANGLENNRYENIIFSKLLLLLANDNFVMEIIQNLGL